jgi:pimeloyl-ACP methyl ester carboxylesterase
MERLPYHHYEVHYCTAGDPKNPCIVCLHPAFGDHRVFEAQFTALAENYFLIAPDMLGHGQTQPDSTSDQLDETIEHLRALLDRYAIQRGHLLGVSLGSLVSQGFAYAYPDRTASVTVVGGYSIHKHNQKLLKRQNREIFTFLIKLLFNMRSFREYVARQSSYLPVGYERMLESSQTFQRKSIRYLQGMRKLFVNQEQPVPYPLLIVYGDHELPLVLEHGQEWAALEPNAQLRMIESAGHCANLEQPEAFNTIYGGFLAGVEVWASRP